MLPDKKHRLETKIKRRTLNPRWNETFYFEGKVHTYSMSNIDLIFFRRLGGADSTGVGDSGVFLRGSKFGFTHDKPKLVAARRKILHNFMCNEHNIIQNDEIRTIMF